VPGFDVESFLEDRGLVLARSHGHHGIEILIECPSCGKPKLSVNAGTCRWICFFCHDTAGDGHGDAAKLVSMVDAIPYSQAKALLASEDRPFPRLRPLERIFTENTEEPEEAPQEPPRTAFADIPAIDPPPGFTPVYDGARWRLPEYLDRRRISRHVAAQYGLGFCTRGFYFNRLVLPFYVEGRMVLWQARTMGMAVPKYLHPSTPNKSAVVFGYDQAEAAAGRTLIVTEGPTDVLRLASWRIPAVALAGKVASPAQGRLIRALAPARIILMLDGDAPGIKAAYAAALVLDALVAFLPDGRDPDESSRDAVVDALEHAREPDLGVRMGLPLRGA